MLPKQARVNTVDGPDLITRVSATKLALPTLDSGRNDPTQEVVLVQVMTEAGRVGLAECNHAADAAVAVLNARAASSIGAGIASIVVGRDPQERETLVQELYERNIMSFRRGLGLAVMHAIDVCLWDLVAQQRDEPLWRTLWGRDVTAPQPYLTLYTGPGSYSESLARLGRLIEVGMPLGYRAAKLEPLVDCVPEERVRDFVRAGREMLGSEVELFVDFGHRFTTADAALRHIEEVAEFGVTLVETPMLADDVWEYARLAELSPVPLAASELYESAWEYRSLLEVGRVAAVQPWPNRVGITETLEVARRARAAGASCILAGWNTTAVGIAVGLHVAAGLGEGIVSEHAPTEAYGFPLRAVAGPEPELRDGRMQLPTGAGLGVTLDPEAVERYAV